MKKQSRTQPQSIYVLLVLLMLLVVSCKDSRQGGDSKATELQSTHEEANQAKIKTEEETKILKGELRIGHELRAFTPCWGDSDYWVVDRTGKLLQLYEKLTLGEANYTPIFVEIEVVDKGKSEDGFSADYTGVYEVIRILEYKQVSEVDCE